MTVGTARIVYIVAQSGAGKTFTGDYLEAIHGFKHVDGDTPVFSAHLPGYADLYKNLKKAMDAPDEESQAKLWRPYFDECARLTLEAAKKHDRVVFTHATSLQKVREHVIAKLEEGGVPSENISFVLLTIDPDVKYRDLYHRTVRQFEGSGIALDDVCRLWGWEFEGEMTLEKWLDCAGKFDSFFKQSEAMWEDWEGATEVDVSGRDITHFDNVDAALGLARPNDWPYEKLCDVVKAVDMKRLEETHANGAFDKLVESDDEESDPVAPSEKDGDEVDAEAIRRRRSSVIQAELINGIREHSSMSTIDREESKLRRSTLILKGKLDLGPELEQ